MKLSRRVVARYVAQQLAGGDVKSREEIVGELAAYVVENRLKGQVELLIEDIAANLARLGHVSATITTARPLTDELRSELAAYVKRIENAKGVDLQEVVDPSIIGGVVVETPNQRFDDSIATKLKRLRNA